MCTSLAGLQHACWQTKVTINQEKFNGGYRIVSLVLEVDCIGQANIHVGTSRQNTCKI